MACFSGISSLSRCEVLALTNALSVAFSDGLSNEDLNALGTLLVAISSIILAFAALSPPGGDKASAKADDPPGDSGSKQKSKTSAGAPGQAGDDSSKTESKTNR